MIIIICELQIVLDAIKDKINPMMGWVNYLVNNLLRDPYHC